MRQVYNPKDWRANTMEWLGCAFLVKIDLQINVMNVRIIIALNMPEHMDMDLVVTVYKRHPHKMR